MGEEPSPVLDRRFVYDTKNAVSVSHKRSFMLFQENRMQFGRIEKGWMAQEVGLNWWGVDDATGLAWRSGWIGRLGLGTLERLSWIFSR